ncbi:hypothetical protein IC582_029939 [Cucumis melo]
MGLLLKCFFFLRNKLELLFLSLFNFSPVFGRVKCRNLSRNLVLRTHWFWLLLVKKQILYD